MFFNTAIPKWQYAVRTIVYLTLYLLLQAAKRRKTYT